MGKELLSIRELKVEFVDKKIPQVVVEDFSLDIAEGEKVGIVGESGSGKTMISLSIAGLYKNDMMRKSGKIIYKGVDIISCPQKELRGIQGREIGVIFQEPMTSLNPLKKIGWQIDEVLRLNYDYTSEERYKKVIAALDMVSLKGSEELYNAYPHQLSGGMRQRVMIAIAFVRNPNLLVADEPTTALDIRTQTSIIDLISKLNEERNMSLVFVSHDLSLVRKLCDTVVVLKDGRVVEKGSVREIFDNPKDEYTKRLIDSIPKIEF